jgi:hypothetical protein
MLLLAGNGRMAAQCGLEAFIRSVFVEQSRSKACSNNALATDARIS